jgi:hypothetical protein
MFREHALPEWFRTSHMLVLGACWVEAYFEERPIFGRRDLILEHAQQLARKKHAEKRRKSSMQEEKPRARRKTSLTILGLGFLIRL